MPQATLFSYFPKPTATSPSSRDHSNTNGQTSVNEKESASCLAPLVATDRLNIISKLEEQCSSIGTTSPTALGSSVQNEEDAEFNSTEIEPACKTPLINAGKGFSNTENFSQIITVPHLPEAIITPIQQSHLPAIQRLTSTTLPVHYSQSFFTSTLTDQAVAQSSRVVLYSSAPANAVPDLHTCAGSSGAIQEPGTGHDLAGHSFVDSDRNESRNDLHLCARLGEERGCIGVVCEKGLQARYIFRAILQKA
ncbi:hypothetical protein, variant [Exophiala xenobiotica]|uniref:Uncharacterized protein n=1 Tax=Exophiala xenobiotica TaxID=348802 RepID=A0A0D2EB95_9EURO|nr:hypothetical protein, variant [Exophiala xenobiotica]KIW51935.1 hypothetical protein, variant [Exophiala xenobiotica]